MTEAASKRGRGRPPGTGKPPAERKSHRVLVYATEAQHDALHAWAAAKGRDLSELLLELGLRAAKRDGAG